MVDAEDPSPMHAARREMIEESGYDSDTIVQTRDGPSESRDSGKSVFPFSPKTAQAKSR